MKRKMFRPAKGAKDVVVGINNAGANGSALKVVETKIAADKSYFIVGDLLTLFSKDEDIHDDRYEYGDKNKHRIAIVTNVGVAGSNETITIRKADGANWKASDITASSKLVHKWSRLSKKDYGIFNIIHFRQKCNFHTGIGDKLNKLIKKLLATKKK